jgi:type IV pilus assembly protein PilW
MVGLVIGLLGVLVIYQVYAVTEGRKRTTTNTNDAQESGFSALMSIERDVRQAGYGFTSYPGSGGTNPAIGCNVQAFNSAAVPAGALNFRMIPVLIRDGGVPNASDTITVVYSSSTTMNSPASFLQPAGLMETYQLTKNADRIGFAAGDFILATRTGMDCSLRVITAIDGANLDVIQHTNAGSTFNRPGGSGVIYDNASCPSCLLINLGVPVITQYFVSAAPANSLSVSDLSLGAASGAANTFTLADNIVSLQAQYGVDLNIDNVIDGWVDATGPVWGENLAALPPTPLPANIAMIKAVRLAIVARSAQMERPAAPGAACDTTMNAPVTWAGGPVINLNADPNWQCYRYKVFQTIIPIRNQIWGES